MQSAPPIALRLLSHTAPLPRCSTSTLTALAARRSFATKASAAVAWSATGQRPAQPLPCTCSALPRRAQLSTRAGSLQASEQIAARTLSVRGQVARSRVLQASRSGSTVLSRLRALHSSPSTRPLSTATATLPSEADARAEAPDPPERELVLTSPGVAKYLLLVAGLVFCIVIVGGMTRLTESGLSITEWNVVGGVLPPLSAADWESEFAKYRATPEWQIQNSHISLDEFKTIYYWEWGHRILGRVIGMTFLLPIPYFLMRRRLSPRLSASLLGIGTLIGGQGALGWYMVKSGLDAQQVTDLGGVPRVSQYRLAAHLGMAFLVYAGCVRLALGVGRDFKIVNGNSGVGAGLAGCKNVPETLAVLNGRTAGRVRVLVNALTALVFLTAVSGAFVAGLDAGLVYNEFPLMGGRLVPPTSELLDPHYATNRGGDKASKSSSFALWRNFFENPTTVQFDHRVLATTTFLSIVSLFLYVRRPGVKAALPPTTYRLIKGSMHMSFLQVALGISTLVYLVPIHLAATHQAGSLVLLSLVLASGASLRRPGKVATELLRKGGKLGQFTAPRRI